MSRNLSRLALLAFISAAALASGCKAPEDSTGGTQNASGSQPPAQSTPQPTPQPAPTPAPPPSSGTGEMTVTWDAPTTNADQTCLSDLSGYRIVYGTASRVYQLNETVAVNAASCVDSGTAPVPGCGNSSVCTYTVRGLGAGTWYVAVQAYDAAGGYSNNSNEIVRSVQ